MKGDVKTAALSKAAEFDVFAVMNDSSDIFADALAALGPRAAARMGEVIEEFGAVPLMAEERLSALASAIALIISVRHGRHRDLFIEALRGLALDISNSLAPMPFAREIYPENGPIDEARDVLLIGIEGVLRLMGESGRLARHRVIVELALISRLLGRYGTNTVHLALAAVADALGDPDWRCGDLVAVRLHDALRPLSRDACLDSIAPRGTA